MLIADIILPLAVPFNFTYTVPPDLTDAVQAGVRVEVQFGPKRLYAGVVKRIYEAEAVEKLKPILQVLDSYPIVPSTSLKLWDWLANYYLSLEGEVMHAALPSGFKLSSQTKLRLNPHFGQDFSTLTDREYLVAEALEVADELTAEEVQSILDTKNVAALIKSLQKKGVAIVQEELVERYKPQLQTFIELNNPYQADETQLSDLLNQLEKRAPKQLAVLMAYIQLNRASGKDLLAKKAVLEKAAADGNVVRAMVEKGYFRETKQPVSRLVAPSVPAAPEVELTEQQMKALDSIRRQWQDKAVVLLHGATASGKTHLYIELIKETLAEGKQALYLLPEIALTSQMIARLRRVFGHDIGIYHSKFNDQERVEIWHKVLLGEYRVVVGARSAVFLPFQNLGVVVVDEEHDPSYKQYEPAPYYQGRDVAIYLASLFGPKPCWVSATPSVESYYNAVRLKKYGLVKLNERYGGATTPLVEIINVKEAIKQNQMRSHFTERLVKELKVVIDRNEQGILFQNRRGYSPFILCADCGWIPQCVQCDVSLTYHKASNELRCHYCGYKRPQVVKCESCGGKHLQIQGFGTEKIEDELQILFPNVRVSRLDLDTTRAKDGSEQILSDFENRKVQFLVGTQMITKGLDFEHVSLVAVLSADHLLRLPRFSFCRTRLSIDDPSKRPRRPPRLTRKPVFIQALTPNHRILQLVLENDYNGFFTTCCSSATNMITHRLCG